MTVIYCRTCGNTSDDEFIRVETEQCLACEEENTET